MARIFKGQMLRIKEKRKAARQEEVENEKKTLDAMRPKLL